MSQLAKSTPPALIASYNVAVHWGKSASPAQYRSASGTISACGGSQLQKRELESTENCRLVAFANGSSRVRQAELDHVDRAGAKSGFAVGKIIVPHALKPLAKTE